MNFRSPAFLKLCKGKPCFLRVDGVCRQNLPTVVPAHSNAQRHGHGGAIKSHDLFSVPGCMACHTWLDHGQAPRDEKEAVFVSAWERWMLYLFTAGLLVIAGARIQQQPEYQPGSKIMQRRFT